MKHNKLLILIPVQYVALMVLVMLMLKNLLQEMGRKRGMTVIIITHNQAITAMADRVIKVKNGTVAKITENPSPTPVEQIEW